MSIHDDGIHDSPGGYEDLQEQLYLQEFPLAIDARIGGCVLKKEYWIPIVVAAIVYLAVYLVTPTEENSVADLIKMEMYK